MSFSSERESSHAIQCCVLWEWKHCTRQTSIAWPSTSWTMLLLTGLLNFILSKRKKSSPPKESKELDGDLSVHITESEEPEQTFSFFHIMSGRRASYLPNVSKLSNSFDCSEAILGLDLSVQNLHNSMSKGDKVNVYFTKSFKAYETEMEVFDIDPDETTSDKAPMIRM
ncbi:hypothetical protein HF521_009331 [Silurus meridionalis]|uniref:Uncharacterized protein n=1 Tax=Silurus meridionalis TaxID=175797 RepID=A0A8T0BTM5_SILME|nr:hypothetical protein HF521_009331 [Silurus meridionalis]